MHKFKLTIGGESVSTPQTFDVLNPATESIVATCPLGNVGLLDDAVAAARTALPAWSALPESNRVAKLNEIADVIESHAQELSSLITSEQGKTQSGPGANLEVAGCVSWTRATAGLSLPEQVIQD